MKIEDNPANPIMVIEKVANDTGKEVNDEQNVSNTFEYYIPMLLDAEITKIFVKNIEIVFEKCGAGIVRPGKFSSWTEG